MSKKKKKKWTALLYNSSRWVIPCNLLIFPSSHQVTWSNTGVPLGRLLSVPLHPL